VQNNKATVVTSVASETLVGR